MRETSKRRWRRIHRVCCISASWSMLLLVPGCSGSEPVAEEATISSTARAPSGTAVDAGRSGADVSLALEAGEQGETAANGIEDAAGPVPVSSTPATSSPLETSGSALKRPQFVEGVAPNWPFAGVVQLWANAGERASGEAGAVWWLRYWSWAEPAETYPPVPLPGMEVDCLGSVGLVSHGAKGLEVGEAAGSVPGSFLVRWGESAQRLAVPSQELLAEFETRPSTVAASSVGDAVRLASGAQQVTYSMRDPARPDGDLWSVQARRDGPLFVLTVHPANHECFSGVTWLSVAETGEVAACGANTWATKFVGPADRLTGELVLPGPDDVGTYLGCASRLELTDLPFTEDRRLAP